MARFVLLALLVLFGPVPFAVVASAQGYPTQTVRFIIPFGPASGTDITARLLADRLTARWGKPVVVENRPGGDGLVSITTFTGANEDHTLLFAPVATFAVHPFMHEKLPYDAERDLLPIVNVTTIVLSITASTAIKVNTLAEFEALVRREPGKYNVAAAAGNSDFLLSGFIKSSGLQVAKIPYRDIMQGPNDLAENRIQLLMSSITIVRALHQAGRVKVLAVTGRKRAPIEPMIPTVSEAGYPQLELESLIGIYGPRGMPMELRGRIAADVRAVVEADPEIKSKLEPTGQVIELRGPADFAAGIAQIRAKLTAIAQALGMKTGTP
jgi:tripartite-type tricarboxylate transporter receptor subunit TctC